LLKFIGVADSLSSGTVSGWSPDWLSLMDTESRSVGGFRRVELLDRRGTRQAGFWVLSKGSVKDSSGVVGVDVCKSRLSVDGEKESCVDETEESGPVLSDVRLDSSSGVDARTGSNWWMGDAGGDDSKVSFGLVNHGCERMPGICIRFVTSFCKIVFSRSRDSARDETNSQENELPHLSKAKQDPRNLPE